MLRLAGGPEVRDRGAFDDNGRGLELGEDGIAHLLRNPFAEDLVYLMGGEAVPLDVLDYPTLGKRFLLHYAGGPPDFYELGEPSQPFGFLALPSS